MNLKLFISSLLLQKDNDFKCIDDLFKSGSGPSPYNSPLQGTCRPKYKARKLIVVLFLFVLYIQPLVTHDTILYYIVYDACKKVSGFWFMWKVHNDSDLVQNPDM